MDLLNYHVNLKEFKNLEEFNNEFNLGENDVVLTSGSLKDKVESVIKTTVITMENYCKGEPDDVGLNKLIEDVRKLGCKRLVAIGGGSVIDAAKICAVAKDDDIDGLFDRLPNLEKYMETIIIPTTCGTGSEVTNVAVVNRTKMNTKMGLACPALFGNYGVLISDLLNGLPSKVFATSSIDALVHAIESALSPKSTPYTEMYSYEAIRMIIEGYKKIIENGNEYRFNLNRQFLLASNYAGLAFGTAGTGCVHAMAYPLGGVCHVAHGESNYTILTAVLKYYGKHTDSNKLARMIDYLSELLNCDKADCLDELNKLLNNILPKKSLKEYGAVYEDLPNWANSCYSNQQRLLKNSLMEMSEEAILEIYQSIY